MSKKKIAFVGKEIPRELRIDKIKDYLKKRKIKTSIPAVVNFHTKHGELKTFRARRCGELVVKWSDVLKALKLK